MNITDAQNLLDELKSVTLPPEFEIFNVTKTVPLMDGVQMTFRLPSAIDLEWASAEANRVAVVKSGLAYSWIPRIIASTLVAINDRPLHLMVTAKHEDIRIGLNELMRRTMPYGAYVDTHQWVFENIIGKIPFDLLQAMYNNELGDWMNSVGGLLVLPTDDELTAQAGKDLQVVIDAAKPDSAPTT